MLVQLLHLETGKVYRIPAAQVVTYNDSGQPIALSYQRDGLIVCTDAAQPDFSKIISELKIQNIKPNA